jgi:tetratricopeptide (TPR) repeat protein
MGVKGGLLVACVVLGASVARADRDGEAWDAITAGKALYQSGDLRGARNSFARARDLVPERAALAWYWLGLTDAKLGQHADAIAELETFLKLSPPEDPRVIEVKALLEQSKRALGPRGALLVESVPPGAQVLLDADDPKALPVGSTPFRNDSVAAGDHLVSVAKPGFENASRMIIIVDGKWTELRLELIPTAKPIVAEAPAKPPVWRRVWFWPVVATGTAAVVAAVALGAVLGAPQRPQYSIVDFR